MNKAQFLTQFHHAKMIRHDADYPLKKPGRPAAVLLPIIEHKDQLTVLFTQRAKHLKHHGGQISFPGGKQETTDNNLLDTALRETTEEVGIPTNEVEVVGKLPIYHTITGFEVTPYIGFIHSTCKLILDENEVHSTFEVPLHFLMNQNNHFVHMANRKNNQHPVYFIPWKSHNIWGATAAFVRTLSNHLSE
ncbi:CoA pyrophosphatase [Paraglaciecola sp.]|uniref:CoA pyrophosphatase n=1 Tax=Paraglaciecola sp. TaxID=1920173 RepID=UPI003EF8774B